MPSAHARLGFQLIAEGRTDDGLKALQQALEANPDDGDCLLGLARVHLMREELERARPLVARLVELEPHHAEAVSHQSYLRYCEGDASALDQLRKAAAAPNASAFALLNLARALDRAGRGAPEGPAATRAALLEPLHAFLRMEAGEAALGRGDAPAAVAHYQAAVAASPHQYLLRAYLAKAHAMAGELEQAQEQLSGAIALAPEEPALHEEMFLLRERMGAFPEAFVEADWLCARFPENLRYLYWLGLTLLRVGKLSEAQPILEQVVSLSSRSAEARQALADVYFRLQDLSKAQTLLEEAQRMDPSSAAVAIDLGRVYLGQGRAEDAERVLSGALRLHPGNPGLHFNLALALENRDAGAAAEHAKKATYARDPILRTEAERLVQALTQPKP
jgi:tetratricopeptide (TPR) repeat protein